MVLPSQELAFDSKMSYTNRARVLAHLIDGVGMGDRLRPSPDGRVMT